jgi:hypothetical protein
VLVSPKRSELVLLFAGLLFINGIGQSLKDTLDLSGLGNPADSGLSRVAFRMVHDLEYSLSCSALHFLNWKQGSDVNLVSILHHLKYQAQCTNDRYVKFSNTFIHELGLRYLADSISQFHPDENTLNTRLELRIGKTISFFFYSSMTTPLLDSYLYNVDSAGRLLKKLCASFMTPFIATFSTGFGLNTPRVGTLSLGLSASRFTWIRNRKVFGRQDAPDIYGVTEEKGFAFEYGISLHLLVDRDLLKRIHWNCDLLIFKNYRKPADVALKNLVGIRLSKLLKMNIQTRLFYEQEVSRNIQVETLLILGLYVNL